MTIASEITRLQWAKTSARTSIQNKWVTVPANAKVDTYHTYIDQINTWVPEEKYETLASVASWAILSYPDTSYVKDHTPFWTWAGYLCQIWNYVFMLWKWWWHSSSWTFDYFDGNIWFLYKQVWASSWSFCSKQISRLSTNSSTSATLSITPVYISSDNSVNVFVKTQAVWNTSSSSAYLNWVIGSNTINSSSSRSGTDLANYKIYDSSTTSRTIDVNDIYSIWFKVDTILI